MKLPMIACLVLEPFALWHAAHHAPHQPFAVVRNGRVEHANDAARGVGVKLGMPLHAALSRAPDLAHTETSPSLLASAWSELLEDLFAYSPNVEPLAQGRALLTAREGPARELAHLLHARVGLATSRETAVLAALSAKPGELRVVHDGAELVFLHDVTLDALRGAGLSDQNTRRLSVLGVTRVHDLTRWSKAQLAAYLGRDWAILRPFLFGPRGDRVQSFKPAPTLEAGFDFDEPAMEPRDLDPVLDLLAAELLLKLATKAAARLTVKVRTPLGELQAAREIKEKLSDFRVLARLAGRALHGTNAAELGVERLELHLGGLHRAARQLGLWASAREADAPAAVLRRFPDALVRAVILDEAAYASDARFEWRDVSSGDVRPTNRSATARTFVQSKSPTAERLPAFFEVPYADEGSS